MVFLSLSISLPRKGSCFFPSCSSSYRRFSSLMRSPPPSPVANVSFRSSVRCISSLMRSPPPSPVANVSFRSSARYISFLQTGASSDELEQSFGMFPAVLLQGLPYQVTLQEIKDFFENLKPVDVVVPHDNSNGSVGVLFSSDFEVEQALSLNEKYMGKRYVVVTRLKREAFYQMALESMILNSKMQCLNGAEEGSVLKMDGVPYAATVADVASFFSGFDILDEHVIFETKRGGQRNGRVLVRFPSAGQASEALRFDKKYMGKRFINLSVALSAEAEAKKAKK